MGLTNHGKGRMLSAFYGQGSSPPASFDIVLYTTLPDLTSGNFGSGGVEVSGTGYVPQTFTNNSTNFPAVSNTNEISNGVAIDFGNAGSNWGTIVGAGLKETSSGNLIDASPITPNQVVNTGNPVRFAIGALKFRLNNPS